MRRLEKKLVQMSCVVNILVTTKKTPE